jgi:Ca-activated chloride channel family protein
MRTLPFLLLALLAQQPRSATTFTSRSELVVLHVSVVDGDAGFVGGLPRDAFVVHENGLPQSVALFEHDDTPVTIGLVIDNSQSMASRREAVIEAGMAFAAASHPADEMFTVNFNEQVWTGLPDGQPFTSNYAELRAALMRAGARGKTALFDALDRAMRHLDDGRQPRKALLVVSDGGDNASRASFEQVLDAALRRDVVIYAIGLADPNDREARPNLLRTLAKVTGGEVFFPRKNSEIPEVMERIARDIRSSYTLGFVPAAAAGAAQPRKIRVDVRATGNRRLSGRSRSLYLGPEGTR